MNRTVMIRLATPEDAAEILKIYAPYVENTAISFEYEVPSEEEFRNEEWKMAAWRNLSPTCNGVYRSFWCISDWYIDHNRIFWHRIYSGTYRGYCICFDYSLENP